MGPQSFSSLLVYFQLGEYISNLGFMIGMFHCIRFGEHSKYANNEDSVQSPYYAASDLSLHCFPGLKAILLWIRRLLKKAIGKDQHGFPLRL